VSSFEESKSKTLPLKMVNFRVLKLKPCQIERVNSWRKKMGVIGAPFYWQRLTEAGIIRATASVNRPLTEAVAVATPSLLMD
jgi:hypothetical protein